MEMMLLLGGAVVSLFIQFIKDLLPGNQLAPILAIMVISIVGAAAMHTLQWFGWWDAFSQVFVTAGAFYAYILRTSLNKPDRSVQI